MADANKTLLTRAEITSNINASGNGRQQLLFDGAIADLGSWTGIRDITGLMTPGQFVSGRLLLAREDEDVKWIFDKLVLPAAADGLSWAIVPNGIAALQPFRPFYTDTKDYRINSAGDIVRLAITTGAGVAVQFAKSGIAINTTVHTFTKAGWPTNLPGVADGEPVVV